jgi:hypothetical protein
MNHSDLDIQPLSIYRYLYIDMRDIIDLVPAPKIEGYSILDELKTRIISRLKDVSLDKPQYKLEVKCILFVAVLIESALTTSQKINKRQFLLDVFKEVYGISEEDQIIIRNTVDMLHLAKRIKKKSWYKLYATSLAECFRL